MKLCDYINECLNEVGVDKVFGIPGSLVMPIWQSITEAEIILCSHEQEAAYVANGYGKQAQKPVAVITTGGPGVTNCISGIASANIDSVPIIYISGRTSLEKSGKGVRQEESNINRMFDSVSILKNITKRSICIDDLSTAAKQIHECIFQAVEHRCGVVHISVPIDFQEEEISVENVSIVKPIIYSDVELFDISSTPLIIMGWGSWLGNSIELIYQLAEKINAPILVTSKGYCCIQKEHQYYLGKLGYGYNPLIDSFISSYEPDCIIAIGTSLGEKDIHQGSLNRYLRKINTYIISDDITMYENKEFKTFLIETNDIKTYISRLIDSTQCRRYNEYLLNKIKVVKENTKKYWESKIYEHDLMAKIVNSLNLYGKQNVVITADAGNHLANVGALYEPAQIGGMFLDVGLRSMGNGICTAVGMAIADGTKTYVAITGDGCMMMNGNIMHLAKERNLPIIFLVFNNHALGRVRVGQSIMNDYRATDIENVDFQAYGKTFGLDTYRFLTLCEFEKDFKKIIKSRRTALVEIITDHDEIPLSVKGYIC